MVPTIKLKTKIKKNQEEKKKAAYENGKLDKFYHHILKTFLHLHCQVF